MVCLNEGSFRSNEEGLVVDHAHGRSGRPVLLTVRDVAEMLNCSPRTVYRLSDSGRMPKPAKLGSLVRWPRQLIERWIEEGCPKAESMEVLL